MTLPTHATAAILVEQGRPLEIDVIELPTELAVGQVFVQVDYSGICGSQIGEIYGVKGPDKYLPHLLGHEGAGKVLAIGPGVRHVAPGDHVVMHWRKGAGIDADPPVYRWRGQRVNAGQVTTFNQYAVVAENRVTRISAEFDLQLAPLMGCAVTTGFGAVSHNAELRIGESIVVMGAGGVGLNIVQAAAMSSGNPVIAVDLFPNRLELARQMGATHLIDASTGSPEDALRAILGPAGADVVVDNTGNTDAIELGYRLTAADGRLILVGVPPHDRDISIHSLPMHFGKRIIGSHGGETQPERDIPRLLRLHAAGRLDLSALITDHADLTNVNDAIEAMRSGRSQGRWLLHLHAS
ncbi:MAG: S-(hydroxymethyl)glutathione dehydrogenase/alcohol dehydrogenase [Rhodothermales bacterium]|jgi:S-(hydroxymethyl)glutathione dehydrogenase/alcohol dehydrogenase